MRGIAKLQYLAVVQDDVVVLAGRVTRLVLALLTEPVLAHQTRFEQQLNGVVQSRAADFRSALFHAF